MATISQWNEAQARLTREQISGMLAAKDKRNDSLTSQLKALGDERNKLRAALEFLPLEAFDKPMDDCDAADYVDHAGEFFAAMTRARWALAKARVEKLCTL